MPSRSRGVADRGYVFERGAAETAPDAVATEFSRDYGAAPLENGRERLYLCEQAGEPIEAEVLAEIDGAWHRLRTQLPAAIVRNRLYTLRVQGLGAAARLTVDSAEWEEGGAADVELRPGGVVDAAASEIPRRHAAQRRLRHALHPPIRQVRAAWCCAPRRVRGCLSAARSAGSRSRRRRSRAVWSPSSRSACRRRCACRNRRGVHLTRSAPRGGRPGACGAPVCSQSARDRGVRCASTTTACATTGAMSRGAGPPDASGREDAPPGVRRRRVLVDEARPTAEPGACWAAGAPTIRRPRAACRRGRSSSRMPTAAMPSAMSCAGATGPSGGPHRGIHGGASTTCGAMRRASRIRSPRRTIRRLMRSWPTTSPRATMRSCCALLGDQYQGGNVQGLPLRHDGEAFHYEGMASAGGNFGTLDPASMMPPRGTASRVMTTTPSLPAARTSTSAAWASAPTAMRPARSLRCGFSNGRPPSWATTTGPWRLRIPPRR